MNKELVLEHLLKTVSSAIVRNKPFSHLCLEQCFPDSFYEDMMNNIPPAECFVPNFRYDSIKADGSPTRFCLPLHVKEKLVEIPSTQRNIWSIVTKVLGDVKLRECIFDKFRDQIEKRYKTKNIDKVEAYPSILLSRDISGYRITPHPDIMKKIITVQFYLADESDCSGMGTKLYEERSPTWTRILRKLKFSNSRIYFRMAKRIEFKKNTGYSFAVTERSWHGVDEIKLREDVLARKSLFLIYYIEPTAAY